MKVRALWAPQGAKYTPGQILNIEDSAGRGLIGGGDAEMVDDDTPADVDLIGAAPEPGGDQPQEITGGEPVIEDDDTDPAADKKSGNGK